MKILHHLDFSLSLVLTEQCRVFLIYFENFHGGLQIH